VRLLLIRHGQTPANVAGTLETAAPGPSLTDLGVRQAAEVPHALRNDPVDGIFASILNRTSLTANPLAIDRSMTVRVMPGLHEIEAGALQGLSDHASVRTYLETAFAWGSGNLDVAMPGGTDGHAFFARFDADLAAIYDLMPSGAAVVFSHGAAIRVWTGARTVNIPSSFAGSHELTNTGVVELDGSPGSWKLISWQGTPVGGAAFDDASTGDVTGETLEEIRRDDH